MLHSKKSRSPARSENKLPCRRSFPEFFVSLTSPWILRLGNIQINLILPSLIRIFDCVLDTRARQYSNKFDIALAYSYLWLTP